mgnify:CR=1 FL=1
MGKLKPVSNRSITEQLEALEEENEQQRALLVEVWRDLHRIDEVGRDAILKKLADAGIAEASEFRD